MLLTFRVLNFPDLTVDGSFTLGGAIGGHPHRGRDASPAGHPGGRRRRGLAAGLFTGFLHTKLKITGLLAGILTMTALVLPQPADHGPVQRTLAAGTDPVHRCGIGVSPTRTRSLFFLLAIAVAVKLLLDWFLATEMGMAVRATGDNPRMIRSLGVDTEGRPYRPQAGQRIGRASPAPSSPSTSGSPTWVWASG